MVGSYTPPPPDHGNGTSKKSKKDRNFRAMLFRTQEGKCFWCSDPMEMNALRQTPTGRWKDNPAFATFEHLIPKYRGGSNRRHNIVLAHGTCNGKRHIKRWAHDPVYGHKPGKTALQAAFERARGAQCPD